MTAYEEARPKNFRWFAFFLTMAFLIQPATATAQTVISPVPGSIVNQYNLDTGWYAKYIDAWGVPILGSSQLDDATLIRAREQLGTLLWTYPYWPVPALNSQNNRIVLVARNEQMSSIPEVFAAFGTSLDARYWGGFGATQFMPITGATEANLMDNFGNENIFVHEFAHTLMDMALSGIDPNFTPELQAAYSNAQTNYLWTNTYAITNIKEYWAEGVQTYFNVNFEGAVNGDGVHNNINTRAELQTYDPLLYQLIHRIYVGNTLP